MPLPNLRPSISSSTPSNSQYTSTYRDQVREKIQSSPRRSSDYRRSIDLNLNGENLFRSASRLRFTDENNLELNAELATRRNLQSAKNRQIIFYNKSYVPSASDTNNDDGAGDGDNEVHQQRRSDYSRPNSRESNSNEEHLRSKSMYLQKNHNNQNDDKNSFPDLNSAREPSNMKSNSTALLNNQNDTNFIKNTIRRNKNNANNNNSNNNNNNTNRYSLNYDSANNEFDSASKSVIDFNLRSASRASFREEEKSRPVPTPRKRDTTANNIVNMSASNDMNDFRIKRSSTSLNRALTPRVSYVPSPRNSNNVNNNNLDQHQQQQQQFNQNSFNQNDFDNNYHPKNNRNGRESRYNNLDTSTQEYVNYQTQKSPVINKSNKEKWNNTANNNSNFINSSTDSMHFEPRLPRTSASRRNSINQNWQ